MINIQIDVTKIDKSRLYTGQKGTYLNATLIPTPNSQYGDYMVVESISKEEREAGKKGTILGNAKNIGSSGSTPQPSGNDEPIGASDLPF